MPIQPPNADSGAPMDEQAFAKQLESLVRDSIREEELITAKLAEMEAGQLSWGQWTADRVAAFGGSWTFIISFLLLLFVWIAGNSWLLGQPSFDPYPFIFLNLILSCVAALQAPIIMMSQNRTEDKDRQRSRNDYLINMKAEIEVRSLHAKFDLLMAQEMRRLFEMQHQQLVLLEEIRKRLDSRV
jgi:uncharacterized membrane protein